MEPRSTSTLPRRSAASASASSRAPFAARPHDHLGYAVKANSSLAIMRLLGQQGAGFDIVSGGELGARPQGPQARAFSKVGFSGVGKQIWEIDAALKAGKILALQRRVRGRTATYSPPALKPSARSRASPCASTPTSLLRLTPTSPLASASTNLVSTSNRPAPSTARPQRNQPQLAAAGVSVHIGSADPQGRSLFAAALTRVASLIADLRKDGHNIRYIDAGGGLGIDYGATARLRSRRLQPRPSGRALRRGAGQRHQATTRRICSSNPGRFIVAQAGALLTRVLFIKKNGSQDLRHHRRRHERSPSAPRLYQAHHEIHSGQAACRKSPVVTADIVGPVCESGDFLRPRPNVLPQPSNLATSCFCSMLSLRYESDLELQQPSPPRRGTRRRRQSQR